MAGSHLAGLRYGARNGKGLQTLADLPGGLGGLPGTGGQRHSGANGISPNGVIKCDGLNALYDGFHINAVLQAKRPCSLQIRDAVLVQAGLDLGHSAVHSFKCNHSVCPPSSFFARINILAGAFVLAVGANAAFVGFLGVLAGPDQIHHLAQMNKAVAHRFLLLI